MDQIYASLDGRRHRVMPDRALRHRHHRQRRRRRHDGARAGGDAARGSCSLERGDFVPQEDENWSPEAVWKDLRYRTTRALARRATARRSSRTRTTTSAATPSSGAACSTGCAARTSRRSSTRTASRRRGRSTTTRSRRTTTAPSGCTRCTARPATIRPSRRADRFRTRRCRTRAAWRDIVDQLRAHGPAPVAAAARLLSPGEPGGCVLCNTCNSFPCQMHAKSDADVCCVRAGADAAERHAVDQRAGPPAAHRRRRAAASRRSRSSGSGEVVRVEAPLVVVSCGAVNSAALLLRSATDRASATASPIRRASSAAATWRTWRR